MQVAERTRKKPKKDPFVASRSTRIFFGGSSAAALMAGAAMRVGMGDEGRRTRDRERRTGDNEQGTGKGGSVWE
jgi:hypothetical protein